MEGKLCGGIVPMFKSLVKARAFIDFKFHKLMNSLELFVHQWCVSDAICSVVDDELIFSDVLM